MKQKSQDIIGKTVVTSSGFVIGEVSDYLIDTTTWSVSDLQIKVEKKKAKELGLKTPFFSSLLILVEVEQIASITDQIIVSLAPDSFKAYVEQRKQPDAQEDAKEE